MPPQVAWRWQVRVRARRREAHRTVAKPTRLALDAGQIAGSIDNEVISAVLSEWNGHLEADIDERKHDRERRAVSDELGMLGHARDDGRQIGQHDTPSHTAASDSRWARREKEREGRAGEGIRTLGPRFTRAVL